MSYTHIVNVVKVKEQVFSLDFKLIFEYHIEHIVQTTFRNFSFQFEIPPTRFGKHMYDLF